MFLKNGALRELYGGFTGAKRKLKFGNSGVEFAGKTVNLLHEKGWQKPRAQFAQAPCNSAQLTVQLCTADRATLHGRPCSLIWWTVW